MNVDNGQMPAGCSGCAPLLPIFYPEVAPGETGGLPYTYEGNTVSIDASGDGGSEGSIPSTIGTMVDPDTEETVPSGRDHFPLGSLVNLNGMPSSDSSPGAPELWPPGKIASRTLSASGLTITSLTISFPPLPTAGNIHPNSAVIDGISDTSGVAVGMAIEGPGIQSDTIVTGILDRTRLQISQVAFPPSTPPAVPAPQTVYGALSFPTAGTNAAAGTMQLSPFYVVAGGGSNTRTCSNWQDCTDDFNAIEVEYTLDQSLENYNTDGTGGTSDQLTTMTGVASRTFVPSENDPALPGALAVLGPVVPAGSPAGTPPTDTTSKGVIEPGAFRVYKCPGCCTNCFYLILVNTAASATDPDNPNSPAPDGSGTVTYLTNYTGDESTNVPIDQSFQLDIYLSVAYGDLGYLCMDLSQDPSNSKTFLAGVSGSATLAQITPPSGDQTAPTISSINPLFSTKLGAAVDSCAIAGTYEMSGFGVKTATVSIPGGITGTTTSTDNSSFSITIS